jgi:transcriptional regulator
MYATPTAKEARADVLLASIRDVQLAALIAATPRGLSASHLPAVLRENAEGRALECHVARANPLWEQIGAGCSAMAIFQGPNAYIHPGWFVSESARKAAVPTWTYVAVHVHGTLTAVHDKAWLQGHLAQLAENNEVHRPQPWSISELTREALEALLKNIVGLQLTIDRIEGSWKMAQGLAKEDRQSVAAALAASAKAGEPEVAEIMAKLLNAEERLPEP